MARVTLALLGGMVGLAFATPLATAQDTQRQSAEIVDFSFQPGERTVDLGTTITWTNHGLRPHTVTDRGGTFDTDPIQPGASKSVTFTVPGRYFYFCRINPAKMNGVVIVRPGTDPPKASRIQALDPAREGAKLSFDPADLQVPAGSTVILANVGGKPHTLTADDGSFDTGVVTPGAEAGRFAGTNATVTLRTPGRFPFHCEVHPAAMKGVLTVTGQAGQAPSAASSAPRQAAVTMKDFEFDKAETSVAPGGKVTFTNAGNAPHTATLDDVQLDTGTIQPGAKDDLTAPDKPGSYSYRCTIHPAKMRGVLAVVGADTADPTRTAAQAASAAPAATTGGGPGGGVTAFVLAASVLAAFLGGFGISAFLRPRATPPPG